MLTLTIPAIDLYDEEKNEFIFSKSQSLQLEHSLVSLAKWESKWKKPFLTTEQKTPEETIDYIRCMTLTQNIDPTCYAAVTNDMIAEVSAYIEDSMTATTFLKDNSKMVGGKKEVITAEVIYYWMIALNIPIEFQKWHFNRLLTLINVCNLKSQPPKKMGKREILNNNRSLNEARLRALGTSG